MLFVCFHSMFLVIPLVIVSVFDLDNIYTEKITPFFPSHFY